jgi:hypothetical protein
VGGWAGWRVGGRVGGQAGGWAGGQADGWSAAGLDCANQKAQDLQLHSRCPPDYCPLLCQLCPLPSPSFLPPLQVDLPAGCPHVLWLLRHRRGDEQP